ncbi:MAG: YlxR family protein [Thermoflavifilum sp.]|nr:YlxR family protein [Thermoflavifilum sp.]MCL6513416.1 YlxR family protein [Alicyclobacillus sp.]
MPRERKVPLRKCVGCQQMFPKRDLTRVVCTPEGEILIDPTGRRNGRGAYLCGNPECLRTARKRKALERALKTSVPEALYDELAARFEGFAGPA